MQVEHLRLWTTEEQEEENPDYNLWLKVVYLIQLAFHNGSLTKEVTWKSVVLLINRSLYSLKIILMEVIWKIVAVILDN